MKMPVSVRIFSSFVVPSLGMGVIEEEEIGRVDVGLAATVHVHVIMGCNYMCLFGSEDQKNKYLEPAARGEKTVAFGLTETGAGSDAAATRTKAVLDGDEWVIKGNKSFITNAGTDITSVVLQERLYNAVM